MEASLPHLDPILWITPALSSCICLVTLTGSENIIRLDHKVSFLLLRGAKHVYILQSRRDGDTRKLLSVPHVVFHCLGGLRKEFVH
jgi:hypothetical protein